MSRQTKPRSLKPRFGIGEWYGIPLTALTAEQRRTFAQLQFLEKKDRPAIPCPFQNGAPCNKNSGVCSLSLYRQQDIGAIPEPYDRPSGAIRTLCPLRFEEDQTIYRWVGEIILDCDAPTIISQVGFLESPPSEELEAPPSDVGKIDKVLIAPGTTPLSWCALELQAVYFQGKAMRNDFNAIQNEPADSIPFPPVVRRPDYRSSGPKRLMPQLQIKVPSLRRWGKKMAVVVDSSFFKAMGKMRSVRHLSNSDVAWFVVRYEQTEAGRFRLVRDDVHFTTLEDSVEGLTAGVPVSLDNFERRILTKLKRFSGPV